MSNKDFAVSSTSVVPNGGVISKKPNYLIILEGNKNKLTYFITLDKPDFTDGFAHAKGFFSNSSEEEIINNISDILTSLKKEFIVEMMFPYHRIYSIRSLVFNAVKNQTLVVK